MLTKVNKHNYLLGTENIINFINNINSYDLVMDNLYDCIIIKNNDETYLYNYKYNKFIKENRIRLNILGKYFWKQIDSFDQNNYLIANKIRKYVIDKIINNTSQNILGIGGEYYIYFSFIKYKKYFGISNHKCIINDSNFNFSKATNFLVDYNNINSFPNIDASFDENFDIIINISNLHENIINFINKLKINKIFIITCKDNDNKIKLLIKNYKLVEIKHFLNIKSWIKIFIFKKKEFINKNNEFISLGSNCSVTYQLNKYNLRHQSYPFDWCKISIKHLINVLENNFLEYSNIISSFISLNHLNNNYEPSLLLSNSYGIKFAHEITSNIEILNFINKLNQRINRFINLKNEPKKIKFIRIEIKKINSSYYNDLIRLINLLKFYTNNFELILIINSEINFDNLPNEIKIYKFNDFSKDWKMDHLDWKLILSK